jgi:hypothetical protein
LSLVVAAVAASIARQMDQVEVVVLVAHRYDE